MFSTTSPETPQKRNRRGRARREAFVRHAVRMIAERGIEQVRPQDIARAVGVSPASFYWYFRDTDDLVRQLITDARHTVRGALAAATEGIDDPLERLYVATQACMRLSLDNEVLRILTAADAEASVREPFASEVHKTTEVFVGDTVRVIAEGQADGTVRRDSTAQHLAYCLRAVVHYNILSHHRGHLLGSEDELAEAVSKFVLYAMCADQDHAREIESRRAKAKN